jgi:hypothetical protein
MKGMRLVCIGLIAVLTSDSAPAGSPGADSSVDKIVAQELANWPKEPGGAAVALWVSGRTEAPQWSVGFKDAWSGDRVRLATARFSVIPAAPT